MDEDGEGERKEEILQERKKRKKERKKERKEGRKNGRKEGRKMERKKNKEEKKKKTRESWEENKGSEKKIKTGKQPSEEKWKGMKKLTMKTDGIKATEVNEIKAIRDIRNRLFFRSWQYVRKWSYSSSSVHSFRFTSIFLPFNLTSTSSPLTEHWRRDSGFR